MSVSNSNHSTHNGFQALYLSILLSVVTIITGVLGYLWLLAPNVSVFDALYMTIITLSTVGYNEVIDLSAHPWARAFTMVLIIFGVGNLLFLFTSITAFLSDNELKQNLKRKKLMKTLAQIENHLIICGIGNVGSRVVRELLKFTQSGKKDAAPALVVIEHSPQVLEKFRSEFPKLITLGGDATDESVLQQAGIKKASQVLATLSDDRDNVLLAVTAKKQNPGIRVIAKIDNIASRGKLLAAGADAVISPQYIGALRMVSEVLNPHSQHVMDRIITHEHTNLPSDGKKSTEQGNYRWQELQMQESSQWVGKRMAELGVTEKFNIPVIAAKNGEDVNYRPRPDTVLKENDVLILIANSEEMTMVRKHLEM